MKRATLPEMPLKARSRSAGIEQGIDLVQHLSDHRRWDSTDEGCPTGTPIQTLDLIREDYARHRAAGWEGHLEWVSLYSRRDRTEESQAGPFVVYAGAERQRRTTPSLLMARLRIEVEPNDLATLGSMRVFYHTSSPSDGPVSISECSVSGVILATISVRS